MRFLVVYSSSAVRVFYSVLPNCDLSQVVGIHAKRRMAGVVYHESFCQRPAIKNPSGAVGPEISPVVKDSIAILVGGIHPQPAPSIGFLDILCVESLASRKRISWHCGTSHERAVWRSGLRGSTLARFATPEASTAPYSFRLPTLRHRHAKCTGRVSRSQYGSIAQDDHVGFSHGDHPLHPRRSSRVPRPMPRPARWRAPAALSGLQAPSGHPRAERGRRGASSHSPRT